MTKPPFPRRRVRAFAHALAAGTVCLLFAGCANLPAPPAEEPPAEIIPVVPEREALADAPAAAVAAAAAAPAAVVIDDTVAFRPRLDPAEDAARLDLWERARRGFALPTLENDLVRKWEQWYAARPDYVQRMAERGGRYLFHVLEEIDRRGMPSDLALLPFVESAFNPQSLSVARAAGLWQFMPATGRDFELRQNIFRDDRRSVLDSTRAALDYLQRLHDQFGDWQLALAAYNWGQGNVQRAVTRVQASGQTASYDNIRMPDETRNYLPKLQAVKNIVLDAGRFGLALPALQNHPFFLTVAVERDIDVALAARLAGLSLDDFQALNPQMNQPVILAAGTPQVLLPYDNANRFVRELLQYRGPLASWTAWIAPKTVKPAEAARQTGMAEPMLRAVNRIPPGMLVKAGSTLIVPRSANVTVDVAEHIADNAALLFQRDAPPLRKVSLKAGKKGETVASIARRYGVSVAQVAQWNRVAANAQFKPGQSILVMVPNRPARVAASKPSTRAPAQRAARPAARTRVAAGEATLRR
jgi:membrane-bound lytic murein transglycosylase D